LSVAVLDASALLALFFREPGATEVAASVESGACISAVNYSEVIKKMIERKTERARIDLVIAAAKIDVVPFDSAQATAAAELYPSTREYGMSFGDRACLALAILQRSDIITAERKVDQLGLPVRVRVIRHAGSA
jgi:ribonuclease VapC